MTRLRQLLAAGVLALGAATAALAEDLPAQLGWAQRVELGTLVSGVIAEVHVRPGQQVQRGARLVSLDSRGFASQVARWKAEVRHAEVTLAEAEREDERAAELYDRTVLSDYERNQATVALEAARARAERAKAALVNARLDLERSVVKAPFDGVVLAVNAAAGQTVVSELQVQPLVTLGNTRLLRATAALDAAQAARLAPGQAIRASARGRSLEATVSYVGFEPLHGGGQGPRYELVAEVDTGDTGLRVGESVVLHLE